MSLLTKLWAGPGVGRMVRVERGETREASMPMVHCGVSLSRTESYRPLATVARCQLISGLLPSTDLPCFHIPDASLLLKFLISDLISALFRNKQRLCTRINKGASFT